MKPKPLTKEDVILTHFWDELQAVVHRDKLLAAVEGFRLELDGLRKSGDLWRIESRDELLEEIENMLYKWFPIANKGI